MVAVAGGAQRFPPPPPFGYAALMYGARPQRENQKRIFSFSLPAEFKKAIYTCMNIGQIFFRVPCARKYYRYRYIYAAYNYRFLSTMVP